MLDEYFISLLVQFFYVLTFCNSKMSHWFSQESPTKSIKMMFCLTIRISSPLMYIPKNKHFCKNM